MIITYSNSKEKSYSFRYFQCVSYGSLPTERHEFAYFLLNMVLMYVAPLVSTLYCSSAALLEIIRRANTSNGECTLYINGAGAQGCGCNATVVGSIPIKWGIRIIIFSYSTCMLLLSTLFTIKTFTLSTFRRIFGA